MYQKVFAVPIFSFITIVTIHATVADCAVLWNLVLPSRGI